MVTPSDEGEIMATLLSLMETLALVMRRMRSIERRLSLLTIALLLAFAAIGAYLLGLSR